MTPNADDLIDTLKKLVHQIDSLDGKAKDLAKDSHELSKTVKLTKDYHQELCVLNNLSESQPRASLISALQDEMRQVRELESENNELRCAIEHHQHVLDIIMCKYQTQEKQLRRINTLESIYRVSDNLDAHRYDYLQEKVNEMVLVMDKACELNETKIDKQQELIFKLTDENNRIKQLLLQNKLNRPSQTTTTSETKANGSEH